MSPIQHIGVQARLGEDIGSQFTASTFGAEDIGEFLLQAGRLLAQLVERQVAGPGDQVMARLHGQAHVDQHMGAFAFQHPVLQLVLAEAADHGGLQNGLEVGFVQAHQFAVAGHGHGGVARLVADQGVLAEEAAGGQAGHRLIAAGAGAADHRLAALDHVEGIAAFAFAHHGFAQFHLAGLELHEQGVQLGRRHLREQPRRQQRVHPVMVLAVAVVLAGHQLGGLGPGHQQVQLVPVDAVEGGAVAGDGVDRMTGVVVHGQVVLIVVGGERAHREAGIDQIQFTVDQKVGLVAALAALEQQPAGGEPVHGDLLFDFAQVRRAQAVEGNKGA